VQCFVGSRFIVSPDSRFIMFDCDHNTTHTGLTYNQLNNNLTSQAATMVTNGLPNDVLSNLDPLALIILIPVFDIIVRTIFARINVHPETLNPSYATLTQTQTNYVYPIPLPATQLYPGLRRLGINFSPLKKITAGFLTGSAAMIWAAVVQHYIYKVHFISPVFRNSSARWARCHQRRVSSTALCSPVSYPASIHL
jgi:hypothetical protein